MCLENKRIIILRFVLFFGVILLVLGCVGSRDNDPNARYIGIVSEGDCDKKEGYWYNNECWSNVIDNDVSFAPDEVATYIDSYVRAKSHVELRINGTEYKSFSVDMFPEESDSVALSIRYLQNDTIFNIMVYLDAQAVSVMESEQGKTAKADVYLVADTYADSNDLSSTIAEGQAYVTETENKENDDGTLTIKGTIESIDVSAVEDVFNIYVFFGSLFVGGGHSTLSIEGDKAYLNGDLGAEAYVQIRDLQKHPEVKTLVLQRVPGSINDSINLYTGRLVRALGLVTYIPSDGEVHSGGVDLFASGVERIVERGGKLGIHAWCCVAGVPADKLVDTHPLHQPYIEYLTEVMGEKLGLSFYFRTIKAAPADGMYIMTEDEMIQSGIATKIIDPFMSQ